MSRTAKFQDQMRPLLPGLLAYFNFADVKRRMSHLGHVIVDKEIDAFDKMLSESADVALRFTGTSWLAFFKAASVSPIESVLKSAHHEQPFTVGWNAEGEKGDEKKSLEQTVTSTIVHTFRCVYLPVNHASDLEKVIEELPEVYAGLPVNVAVPYENMSSFERKSWRCVDVYPIENPCCPFCEGREFDWIDGDMSVYSGYGTCKQCAALVDIRGVERFG